MLQITKQCQYTYDLSVEVGFNAVTVNLFILQHEFSDLASLRDIWGSSEGVQNKYV